MPRSYWRTRAVVVVPTLRTTTYATRSQLVAARAPDWLVLYVNVQFVMPTISASTARETLPAQLDRVERGEEVAITRHGRVVAVLVSPDVLRSRRASGVWNDADRIDERLQTARSEPLRTPVLDPDRADELVKEVRRGRSGR